MSFVAVALVGLAAAAGPRSARPPGDPIAAATRAMGEGEFERALKHLAAIDARSATDAELAKVHLMRARCHFALRAAAKAEAAMREALKRAPEAAFGADEAGPRLLELFEAVRARTRGTLTIEANEATASARVDGKPVGPVPVTIDAAVGRRTIEVSTPDGTRYGIAEAVVRFGQTTHVSVSLAVAEGLSTAGGGVAGAQPTRPAAVPAAGSDPGAAPPALPTQAVKGAESPARESAAGLIVGVGGVSDMLGRSIGIEAHAGARVSAVDLSARVRGGAFLGVGVLAAYRIDVGRTSALLGLRADFYPSIAAIGAGGVAGARVGIAGGFGFTAMAAVEGLMVSSGQTRRFAVSLAAGIDFRT